MQWGRNATAQTETPPSTFWSTELLYRPIEDALTCGDSTLIGLLLWTCLMCNWKWARLWIVYCNFTCTVIPPCLHIFYSQFADLYVESAAFMLPVHVHRIWTGSSVWCPFSVCALLHCTSCIHCMQCMFKCCMVFGESNPHWWDVIAGKRHFLAANRYLFKLCRNEESRGRTSLIEWRVCL